MSKEKEEAERIFNMYDKVINSITTKPIKSAALIHVDALINNCQKINKFYEDNGLINSDLMIQPHEHLKLVKQEIEKL